MTDPWVGDDDTSLEYLYMHELSTNPSPTNTDLTQTWIDHIVPESFYIANRQGGWLIEDGLSVPDSGSIHKNMHWYAIDSQITTETIGSAAPGMRQRASDLVGQFGAITNDGYSVHAAAYYGAMYAAAAFESDVEQLVAKGLEVVPQTSRTRQVIEDVVNWYTADKADQTLDWRATQEQLYDKYGHSADSSYYRYRYWIESTVNAGMTTLALLYGQGDFVDTVQIGVLGGWDADCNPATAGGLIGIVNGFSGLPADLTSVASDDYVIGSGLTNINTVSTISGVAEGWQAVAEAQILAAGGSITGEGANRTYHLPDADDVSPPLEKPDPAGPGGLVRRVLDAGGRVGVSASVEYHYPYNDRKNLDAVIDGIIDVSYNGHLPYVTDDGNNPQPAGGDYYQLDFDRDVTFVSVTFHEGDIIWNGINTDPKVDEPKGGYFLNLTVQVGDGGQFTEVSNVQLSEPLDAYEYFQQITLSFVPVAGDAIRIRGDAGGRWGFTSIVELESLGFLDGLSLGDANCDLVVDIVDLTILAANWGQTGWVNWVDGDFMSDQRIDIVDLTALAANWTFPLGSVGEGIPEPASVGLFVAIGLAVVASNRRRTDPRGAKNLKTSP